MRCCSCTHPHPRAPPPHAPHLKKPSSVLMDASRFHSARSLGLRCAAIMKKSRDLRCWPKGGAEGGEGGGRADGAAIHVYALTPPRHIVGRGHRQALELRVK